MLGPIPSTAWIPIVLIAFPSAVSASAFLIALAVWFPTTVLTSSGIASIPNSYFEVSSTLGAGSLYRIVMVGSISISGVSKHFINPSGERITALDNVSLEIPSGSFVSLIGPSGCGKSTLLRLISGLIPMDEGELTLDEPLGALDAFTRMNMQDEILRIWKETGMTAIMVTHDVDEAVYLSDKVVVMTPRPGRITGTLDIKLARPRARSSEDFLHYRAEILRQLHYGGTIKEPNYYI